MYTAYAKVYQLAFKFIGKMFRTGLVFNADFYVR